MKKIIEQVQMVRVFCPAVPDWDIKAITLFKEEYTTQERANELLSLAKEIYKNDSGKLGGDPELRVDWETIKEEIIY
jgi:hypothetical protein